MTQWYQDTGHRHGWAVITEKENKWDDYLRGLQPREIARLWQRSPKLRRWTWGYKTAKGANVGAAEHQRKKATRRLKMLREKFNPGVTRLVHRKPQSTELKTEVNGKTSPVHGLKELILKWQYHPLKPVSKTQLIVCLFVFADIENPS